ncbi:MAG TPA: type II secretion system F family protein [Candidatus Binataceae bacterium]|nr:type II secretion system F family protein [Candidatus Binataceae bacterium]
MSPLFVSLCVFCLMGASGVAIYAAFYGGNRIVEDRLNDLAVKIRAAQGAFADTRNTDESFARTLFRWAAARVPAPDLATPSGEKLAETLMQAGFFGPHMAHYFQVLRVLASLLTGLILLIAAVTIGKPAGVVVLLTAMGFVLGAIAPSIYIRRRARLRQMAIARQLSDILDLLVVCVEAGLGLHEAIKVVATESERQGQEIGRELSLVASEISAGATLGQALRNLAERTAVEDIRPLAATLIQSEQLGGQIAPALHASSDALRVRRRLRAEEAAQKTTIKILFPLVLFILPAMLMVIVGPAIIEILHTLKH